jgi:hypothetical protein
MKIVVELVAALTVYYVIKVIDFASNEAFTGVYYPRWKIEVYESMLNK